MEKMTTSQVYRAYQLFSDLKKVERAINKIDTDHCNGVYDEYPQDKLDKKLEIARELTEPFGLSVRHQSDPRGVSLYLTDGQDSTEIAIF